MATTAEGRRKHEFSLAYEGTWTVEELEKWLAECRVLGASSDTVVRYRAKGTLGPSGFAGLYVLLPLPARDAGSTDPEEEGGGTDGESSDGAPGS
jgi:hypothetical protein